MNTNTLNTNNEEWGFFGTISHHADAQLAWPLAMVAIANKTGCPQEAVRDFLDSRHGRHFADDVVLGLFAGLALDAAIDAAISNWMGWKISRSVEREMGIPRGLPMLIGFVAHFEIEAEAFD